MLKYLAGKADDVARRRRATNENAGRRRESNVLAARPARCSRVRRRHDVTTMTFDPVLPLIFLALMGISMLIYVVSDGYDLGVGMLMHRADATRRT